MSATLKILLAFLLYLPCFCSGLKCDLDQWYHVDVDDTYVIFTNKWLLDYHQSLAACRSWGGNLVTIKSQEKGKAIQDYLLSEKTTSCLLLFRIGLFVTTENQTDWADGTRLKPNDYANFEVDRNVNSCYSIKFCLEQTWKMDDCKAGRHFLCESKDPCQTAAAILYDDKELVRGKHISVSMNQAVNMSCHTHGYFEEVSKVEFRCGSDSSEGKSGETEITRSFTFGPDMHMGDCTCMLTLDNGEKRVASVYINIQVPVTLKQANENDMNVSVEPGSTAVFEFEIVANPLPSGYKLLVMGSEVEKDLYEVTFEETGEPFHYTVKVQIQNVTEVNAGSYSFVFQNGTDTLFDFPFQLRVDEETGTKKKAKESEDGPWLYLIFMLLAVTTIAIIAVFVFTGKSKKKDSTAEGAQRKDSAEEGDEEAEEAVETHEYEEDEPQTAQEDETSATATEK